MDRQFSQNRAFDKKQTASLDRIDSNEGYIVGNVQWVHLVLNRMKSNLKETQFIEWCNLVVKHNQCLPEPLLANDARRNPCSCLCRTKS